MIAKQTVVNQIEITSGDTIQIRIALQLIEDGVVISNKWHRTVIPKGGDVDAQMSVVNTHLAAMNEKPVSVSDIDRIKKYASIQ